MEVDTGPEIQGLADDMAAVKKRVLDLVEPYATVPQVVHPTNQLVIKLDEAYMWLVVALKSTLAQVDPAAVEKMVKKKVADGDVVPLEGK